LWYKCAKQKMLLTCRGTVLKYESCKDVHNPIFPQAELHVSPSVVKHGKLQAG
jgi:hypothetical protein